MAASCSRRTTFLPAAIVCRVRTDKVSIAATTVGFTNGGLLPSLTHRSSALVFLVLLCDSGYIYYDHSIPMPPASLAGPPSLKEQWHSLTKLLKVFLVLLLAFWLLQWFLHWTVALWLPILFLPSYLLYNYWKKHYQSLELYLLVRLFATAFVPGSLVVMLIESLVTLLFLFLCFQSALGSFFSTPGSTPSDVNPDKQEAPSGMEFLNEPESPQLFIFLFLLSYVSAGCVEEGLKYVSEKA
jgi:hypothetical protein